jgi:hypothetical protein
VVGESATRKSSWPGYLIPVAQLSAPLPARPTPAQGDRNECVGTLLRPDRGDGDAEGGKGRAAGSGTVAIRRRR